MSFIAKIGTETAPSVTGNVVKDLSAYFSSTEPLKAILLWSTYDQDAGGSAEIDIQADSIFSIGFGTYRGSVVQQRYITYFSKYNVTPTQTARGKNTTAILKGLNASTPVVDFEARLASISNTGFTLNWVDLPTGAIPIRFHYLALGGSDLDDALVGSLALNATTSPATQDITVASGIGQPGLIFFLDSPNSPLGESAGRAGICMGVGIDDANQAATYLTDLNGQANTSMEAWQKEGSVVLLATGGGSPPTASHDVSLTAKASWPADGFQITKNSVLAGTSRDVFYLALFGTFSASLGEKTVPTSSAPQLVDHFNDGRASGAVFFGTNLPASTAIVNDHVDLGHFWLGGGDGNSGRLGGAGIGNDDNNAISKASRHSSDQKPLRMFGNLGPPGGYALASEAIDVIFAGSKATLEFNDTDGLPRAYLYLILGDEAPAFTPDFLYSVVSLQAAVAGQPANTVLPVISGTKVVGQTLSATNGTWTNSPASYTYQWLRSAPNAVGSDEIVFSPIIGATSSTYVLTNSDDVCFISIRVTAVNAAGSTDAFADGYGPVTEPIPVNTVLPSIVGSPEEGTLLNGNPGTWSNIVGLNPTLVTEWQISATGTGGWSTVATGSSYTPVASDVGKFLRLQVTGINSGGSVAALSSVVGPVQPGSVLPPVTPPPPTPQPLALRVTRLNEIERMVIEESPQFLWPRNQESNFGVLRTVLSNPLQDALETLTILWQEMFLLTVDAFLTRLEEQMGLPPNPIGYSIQKRKFILKGRLEKGPFTYQRRENMVWYFLAETFGEVLPLTYGGVALSDDGIPLYNEGIDAQIETGLEFLNSGLEFTDEGIPLSGNTIFAIVENNPNFKYTVRILDTYALDPALERELIWMTPAGITAEILYVPEL